MKLVAGVTGTLISVICLGLDRNVMISGVQIGTLGVESRSGVVARGVGHRLVSPSRSSNRMCGFPASGFPTVRRVKFLAKSEALSGESRLGCGNG